MNPKVDQYLIDGCGRCPLGGTPQCKVNDWREELELLREIVLDCGLTEELKWSVPCYTFQKKNILIVSALKDYASVSFFKGSLLQDTEGLLVAPGKNTQAARLIKFTSRQKITEWEQVLKRYIFEAIEVEKAGLQVDFKKKKELVYPAELQEKMSTDAAFAAAFDALTPGRQRGYVLYFSSAKQSKTRESRIDKYIPWILEGKGMHDR